MMDGNGGDLALAALGEYGVRELFTLNGAHIWPLYDGARRVDVRVVDTRHEQTAAFAAEGLAKLLRRPGVAALTAGPGVTNGVSPVASAQSTGAPLIVLGGRAAAGKWGQGSLQEFDHIPMMKPLTKFAATAETTASIASVVGEAAARAMTPHKGPAFVDFGIDTIFGHAADVHVPAAVDGRGLTPDESAVAEAAALIAGAERPILVAGTDVYWNRAESALRAAVEALRVPTFVNGLGRGCLPADHELAFSRTRRFLKEADVVVVVGTPLDFRLSFGAFGDAAVVHVVDDVSQKAGHVSLAAAVVGDLALALEGFAAFAGQRADHEPWIAKMRDEEESRRAAEAVGLASAASPIHPARVYGELRARLDRDAIVINDGGDFVSFSGKFVESYQPGCWLDPGPLGCLGTGLGYAIGARVAHPDRQIVAMLGDGAAGFSLMDVDTLVRHRLPVVMVVGNNGIWALEKIPMQAIYGGWDAACDLQPGCRYDDVVKALGGAGETVTEPDQIGPALDRAFASGVPYLVNVLTDPTVAYPRTSSLV
jgi:acetolactate synthase I/II/III large subunit